MAGWSRSTRRTGSVVWETVTVDQSQPYTITGAPRAPTAWSTSATAARSTASAATSPPMTPAPASCVWRFYTVPGDPSKGPDSAASDPIMAKAAATWNGQWWKLGGGGHRLGRHRLRRGLQSGDHRRRQRLAVEPAASDRQAAATTGSSRPSSRSMRHRRLQVALPDDTRRHLGLHRHAAHHACRVSRSTASRGRSRCRRRRTASSTSSTARTAS